MMIIGVVPHKPCHFPRVRRLGAHLTVGPQLGRYVNVIELLKGGDEAAMGGISLTWYTRRHRQLMSSTLHDDSGGAVAGVVSPPLPVFFAITPLLARAERGKVFGK